MVKDFIDTNEFTREQLVDMIELSLAIKRAIRRSMVLLTISSRVRPWP